MDLSINYLRDIGFAQAIKRGTAEILEENEYGLFIKDTLGKVFMLTTDDYTLGCEWLVKHEDRNYELLTLYRDDLICFARERFGLVEEMRCYQGVWTKPSPPERKGLVCFHQATKEDIPFVREHYEEWDDEWGTKIIETGNLFIATITPKSAEHSTDITTSTSSEHSTDITTSTSSEHSTDITTSTSSEYPTDITAAIPVGFMGEHLEGAIGLLHVLPEYRNRGYAQELEAFMIEHMMKKGQVPYGHVVVDNEASMELQKKMGFEFWDGTMSWLFSDLDTINTD